MMDFLMVAVTAGVTLAGIAIAALFGYKTNLSAKSELKTELKTDINNFRTEVKADINKLEANMDKLRTELKSDFRAEIGSLRTELNANIVSSENKIKLEFAETFYRNSNGNGGSSKKPAKKTERPTT